MECAQPHEDPAKRTRTVRRVPRPDPGAVRQPAGPRQACARSAPATLRETLYFCVYFRFRCVEPLGVVDFVWNCRDDGHRLECEVRC